MHQIDKRVIGLVIDAADDQLLPDQRHALPEYFFPALREIDIADLHRPRLAAGNGVVGWVFKPVAVLQPVDDAALEIGDVAGHALDLRIGNRLDDDVVADPVDANLTHDLRMRGSDRKQCQKARKQTRQSFRRHRIFSVTLLQT